jgi:Na+/H+-dicarboxylate symporter
MTTFQDLLRAPAQGLRALTESVARLQRAKLWLQVLIAMALGIAVGTALSSDVGWVSPAVAETLGEWIALPGQLFLALIQMIVVPLILASIVQGISAAGSIERLKSTGVWAISFFLATTVLAVGVGIGTGLLIQPGQYIKSDQLVLSAEEKQQLKALEEQSQEMQSDNQKCRPQRPA